MQNLDIADHAFTFAIPLALALQSAGLGLECPRSWVLQTSLAAGPG